ncbi:MAG: hypothetical protein P1T08_08410 [Acidimicrobiia bacterium]|nr:hypothetical protein [Acidimicrobiia bacterium]
MTDECTPAAPGAETRARVATTCCLPFITFLGFHELVSTRQGPRTPVREDFALLVCFRYTRILWNEKRGTDPESPLKRLIQTVIPMEEGTAQ